MSRGLSELQKTLLTMPPDQSGNILVRDVITKYYGWAQNGPGHFSKKEIGEKKYISAYIAIRKSLKRLESRGLIWCPDPLIRANNFSKYTLTSDGRELSAKLNSSMVKPSGLTPEEIAILNRADEPPEGSPHCDPWAGMWICKQCWGGAFESLAFIHGPTFCPLCGAKNTVVRLDNIPDWMERIEKAKRRCNPSSGEM